jgi:heme/copper-type cytochrome/quinol oxidase subunit 2
LLAGRCLPAVLALAILLVADVALGCPTCKDSLASDPAAANLVRGYFWSILFMMSMPFLILGSLSAYFYWEIRKARAQQQTLVAASQATQYVAAAERELVDA